MNNTTFSSISSDVSQPFSYLIKTIITFGMLNLLVYTLTRGLISLLLLSSEQYQLDPLFELFSMGLRFDLKIIAVLLILLVLLPLPLICLINRWRFFNHTVKYSLLTALLISALISFIDIGFYFYFGTQINGLAFGIVEDGTEAVLISIFSDSRLVLLMVVATISLGGLTWLYLRCLKQTCHTKSEQAKWKTIAIGFVLLVIFALLARGSFDKFPLSRKTAVVSDNALVNSLTMNGPFHLYYSIKDRAEDNFSQLTTRTLLRDAKLDSATQLKNAAGFTSTNPLKAKSGAKKAGFKSPNVIFVLMEGWSSHIALQHSLDNQVLGAFSQHAEQDYFFPRFFSNKYGTNPSIENLLLNSPVGPISQSSASLHSFSGSSAKPFKAQGYNTLFLSGGNISWRKHGQFWPRQGFDRYIARASIESFYKIKADNPWGVYDEYLFKYLQRELELNSADTPLFSFVLTTNNHGPIRLPANYLAPPLAPQKYGFAKDDSKKHESLTGFHYQSNALGQFMSWLKQSDYADNTIVVATGDHVLKGFANYADQAQAFNRYAVPAYFYVPPRYDQLKNIDQNMVGSHQDLFPTLFELALDRQTYWRFGQPMMNKTVENAYGWIDQGAYIFQQGISYNAKKLMPWKNIDQPLLSAKLRDLTQQQLRLISQQKYQNILRKYELIYDFKGNK